MNIRPSRWFLALAGVIAAAILAAAPAHAHIQVLPSQVAPADPVLFTVLVPGETSAGTTKVELKVPEDTFPFSFEDTPGWNRKMIKKPNGLIDRVIWTGKAAADGLVRFTFLAGTPEKPTTIKWPAIQTYADGQVANWIGSPDSDNPAPVVEVSDSAPRQNAGGEGSDSSSNSQDDAGETKSDESPWPITAAETIGLAFGVAALVLVVFDRRRRKS